MTKVSDGRREGRGARFEIISDQEGYETDSDYILLDIPPSQLQQVFDKIVSCKQIDESLNQLGKKSPPDSHWVVHLSVRPHHQALISHDESGKEVVVYPPSLLRDDIPRDDEKGLVRK